MHYILYVSCRAWSSQLNKPYLYSPSEVLWNNFMGLYVRGPKQLSAIPVLQVRLRERWIIVGFEHFLSMSCNWFHWWVYVIAQQLQVWCQENQYTSSEIMWSLPSPSFHIYSIWQMPLTRAIYLIYLSKQLRVKGHDQGPISGNLVVMGLELIIFWSELQMSEQLSYHWPLLTIV